MGGSCLEPLCLIHVKKEPRHDEGYSTYLINGARADDVYDLRIIAYKVFQDNKSQSRLTLVGWISLFLQR